MLSGFLWNEYGLTVGKQPTVKRFLKGVFECRPPIPKYVDIWDVNIVLDYLKLLFPLIELSLRTLTHKLVMLMKLVTAQRGQTLSLLDTKNLVLDENKCSFVPNHVLKNSTPRNKIHMIEICRFSDDRICPLFTLKEYLARTVHLRTSCTELFISFNEPHHKVTTDTINRWIKFTMAEAGIDTAVFKSHSTRAAAVSTAADHGVDIDTIMKVAGWTNAETFATFYKKPIQYNSFTEVSFGRGQITQL